MAVFRHVVQISQPDLGGSGVNVWHIRNTGDAPVPAIELEAMSGAIRQFYEDIDAYLPSDGTWSFDGELTEIGVEDPQLQTIDGWSVPGATTTQPLPPANCMVVSWRTTLAGRRGRGRTFIGPVSIDTLQDNGTPTETAREAFQDAADALIATVESELNGGIGVWSTMDEVLRDFVSANVPNEFAVLRSRRD